jgi:hypothetical protein
MFAGEVSFHVVYSCHPNEQLPCEALKCLGNSRATPDRQAMQSSLLINLFMHVWNCRGYE